MDMSVVINVQSGFYLLGEAGGKLPPPLPPIGLPVIVHSYYNNYKTCFYKPQ